MPMSFQPPILLNGSAAAAYALLFQTGGVGTLVALIRSGEYFIKPIFDKPATNPKTTDAQVIEVGSNIVTPKSMDNIKVGTLLLVDTADKRETVFVTAVTATTFTATFAVAHDGTTTAFDIGGATFPTALVLPTASPAPAAGVQKYGWWRLVTATEKRTMGTEPAPAAGSPIHPGGAYDRVYGALLWCVSAGELELNGH